MIIQLNLIRFVVLWHTLNPTLPDICFSLERSVRQILQILQEEWESTSSKVPAPPTASSSGPSKQSKSTALTDDHRRIRMRLSPLLSLEQVLTMRLFPSCPNQTEISVRGGSGWKSFISKALTHGKSRPSSSAGRESDETTTILSACRDDIIALWHDSVVRQVLNSRNARLHEMPGL